MLQTNRAKGVDSARRVLQILLSFTETSPQITVEEISKRFEISIPSAYRYISLLRELYLIEERGRGGFTLTPQVFRLAAVAESSLDIGYIGKPVIDRLVDETHETVLILRRIGESALCVASSIPNKMATISFKPGNLMPLHRGAGAKALLASTTANKREKYLKKLHQTATMTTDELELLRKELTLINTNHYSISDSEVDEGVYAVAAPIVVEGRTVAALSIAGLSFRLDSKGREALLNKAITGAREISDLIHFKA